MLLNDSRELFRPEAQPILAHPPIVVTDCLKTPENIGHLIRLSANTGIRTLVSIEEIQLKDSRIKKTACMAWDYVQLIHATPENFETALPDDYTWVALETTSQSTNLFATPLPNKMAIFLGNEIRGIRPELLDRCPIQVHIPMWGPATSMNVSHAAAVCFFEWVRQQSLK